MSAERWFADANNLKAQGDFCYLRGDWRGSYRAYGMATEHLIKAIYLRNTQQKEMPPFLRTAASHDLIMMAEQAGLRQEIATFTRYRRRYWAVVKDYDHTLRYPNGALPRSEARDFRTALLNPGHGVWSWLLNHYQGI